MRKASLSTNALWTSGLYGVRLLLRLGSNIVLSRLLFPEVFGVMALVNSLRAGAELLSDIGLGQNIIQNRNGADPSFLNTAWTIQIVRGFILAALFLMVSPLIDTVYDIPDIGLILMVSSCFFIIGGFQSMNLHVLQKTHRIRDLELYQLIPDVIGLVLIIGLAYYVPSVWTLVLGSIIGVFLRTLSSFMIPGPRPHLTFSRDRFSEIFSFGKWVFLSSVSFFAATNFDRLYLAKVMPLDVLGIFGVARALTDILNGLVTRLTSYIVFPMIAEASHLPMGELRARILWPRATFLAIAAILFGSFLSIVDLIVALLYDPRYSAAEWMVLLLSFGMWLSVLSSFGEAIVTGTGRPALVSLSSWLKFGFLVVAAPLGFAYFGVVGALVAFSLADLPRFIAVQLSQQKLGISFFTQDMLVTCLLVLSVLFGSILRYIVGFGTLLDQFPLTVV